MLDVMYVMLAVGARLTMVLLIGPDWPVRPLPLQLKLVTPAGKLSVTLTFVAVLGPLFVAIAVARTHHFGPAFLWLALPAAGAAT